MKKTDTPTFSEYYYRGESDDEVIEEIVPALAAAGMGAVRAGATIGRAALNAAPKIARAGSNVLKGINKGVKMNEVQAAEKKVNTASAEAGIAELASKIPPEELKAAVGKL